MPIARTEKSMKLYYSPAACSLSPHIVAREAGTPIELVKVNLETHKTADGTDFYAINPKGYVPFLALDDGSTLSEGPAIVQYLADRAPASGLVPAAGTPERYHLQEWLNYISTELHKALGGLFDNAMPDAYKAVLKERIGKRFDYLTRSLEHGQYLMGDRFTVADAYLFTVLGWTKWLDIDLARWPVLSQYVARVGARPKVVEALKAEGLVK
jgi:glutathione S-transferase